MAGSILKSGPLMSTANVPWVCKTSRQRAFQHSRVPSLSLTLRTIMLISCDAIGNSTFSSQRGLNPLFSTTFVFKRTWEFRGCAVEWRTTSTKGSTMSFPFLILHGIWNPPSTLRCTFSYLIEVTSGWLSKRGVFSMKPPWRPPCCSKRHKFSS